MPANIEDIAYEFGITEEELTTEALRLFLKEHMRQLETELQACYAKAGVDSLQGMEKLLRQGEINGEDFREVRDLTDRAHRIGMLLEDLLVATKVPPTLNQVRQILKTKVPPTLNQVRQILKAKTPALAEAYGVKVIGIYGPYAAGKPRPYDHVGLLVELQKPMGLEFFGLERELSRILGAPVRLSTKNVEWPGSAERIMSELVPL
jgi:predicted nucleotidyltransferase